MVLLLFYFSQFHMKFRAKIWAALNFYDKNILDPSFWFDSKIFKEYDLLQIKIQHIQLKPSSSSSSS